MIDLLPRSVEIKNTEIPINWDYRCALDIMEVLADSKLSNQERGFFALGFFYPTFREMPPNWHQEATQKLFWFLRAGEPEEGKKNAPKLMDWKQDFRFLVPPISKAIGRDIREPEPLHWWTFLAGYMEMGECTFSQIVSIRRKLARREKLSKTEQSWYRENKDIVKLRQTQKFTEKEMDIYAALRGET